MAQYGVLEYWNERYTKEKDSFDWYQRYAGIKHLLAPSNLSPEIFFPSNNTARVLVPGCGNSLVMEHMIKDGYKNITNIDFSPVVISQMKERYKESGMIFDVVDVTRSLPFPDSSFDLIFCKGTFDAILCSTGATISIRTFIEESARVLDANHGIMVIVTYGSRENRMQYLEDSKVWPGGVDVFEVPKPEVNNPNVDDKGPANHFVYICRKSKGNQKLEEKFDELGLEEKKMDHEDSDVSYCTESKL